MVAIKAFNPADVPESQFTPLPVGKYKAVITSSEMGESKAGNPLITFVFEIIDGEYKGRTLKTWCNYEHPNETARAIAERQLADMALAANVANLQDTSQLHNQPMLIDVKQRKRDDNGEMQNEIKGYYSLASQTVEAPSQGGDKPWEKK